MSWASLIAIGISGGILPCPAALVVLLSAVSLGRIGFGLLLVAVFSLGLGAVLTGLRLILVYARRWFEHLPIPQRRFLPALSALFIVLVGLGMATQAWLQVNA